MKTAFNTLAAATVVAVNLTGVAQVALAEKVTIRVQFMILQLIGLALILSFPQIALWLPQLMYGE